MVSSAFADTNLFLRFLTQEPTDQAQAAERVLQRAAAGELVLVTTPLVFAELAWTLKSFYGRPLCGGDNLSGWHHSQRF